MRVGAEMISAGSGFSASGGGMVVYYSGLLGGLCRLRGISEVVALTTPWNGSLGIPDDSKVRARPCVGLPRNRVGRVLYEQSGLPLVARRAGIDVLLSTCNVRPLAWTGPSVVVLQSLQYLHFPTQFGPARRTYLKTMVRTSLRTADRVIAVSEWERAQAIRHFGLEPSRIVTVHHGVSEAVREVGTGGDLPERSPLAPDEPYLLMVSSLYGFKNHRRLVRAFARVVSSHGVPHRLVLAGGDADVTRAELAALAANLGIGDRVLLLGAVPHDDVPPLLAHADGVAYVSLYETFGHPVLEAMAFGRPLVTSDVGAMAEVAGGAARLVEPTSVESIAAGLIDVLTNEEVRRRLTEAGPLRASSFTWDACAEKTASVLSAAVTHNRATRVDKMRA